MGAVATSELQAAEAGRDVLRAGGTAIDAAIATAAALTVTEPTSNGLGGDLFALVHHDGRVAGLAANGASPAGLPVDALRARNTVMPLFGWPAVTVPGQVSGWGALHARFGRLPFAELLAPAIRLATAGFRVGPVTAAAWARALPVHRDSPTWLDTFTRPGPDGAPETPAAGGVFANPALGESLALLAEEGPGAFYAALGPRIAAWAQQTGGWLTAQDFARHEARWVTPLQVRFRDWTVYGMTAPTQGVCTLEALGILAPMQAGAHEAIEAVKLAFADTYATVADPAHQRVPERALLDPAHLDARRSHIGPRAGPSPAPPGIDGGTVLLCAVDDAGMSASVIQSNFMGFGSGLVVPGTGIALQNRGAGFVLDPAHPNALGAGKHPFHTILPGLIATPHGVGPFGCMGGQMQPQGQVQLVTAMHAGARAQDAIDAKRWRWLDHGPVALEEGFDEAVAADLEARGHALVRGQMPWLFGGAQVLLPREDGWDAGSDPRKDGGVAWS